MTSEQQLNLQSVLDKAKVLMARDRGRLLSEGKLEESFELLDRQQKVLQLAARKMNERGDEAKTE